MKTHWMIKSRSNGYDIETSQRSTLMAGFKGFWFLMLALAACTSARPPASSASPTPDPVATGREVYLRVCAQCHGEKGEGYANEMNAPALDSSEHAWQHADQQIYEWIVNGKPGLGRLMPAYGDQLNDQEVYAVIAYLHTLLTPQLLEMQQDITARWPGTPQPTRQP